MTEHGAMHSVLPGTNLTLIIDGQNVRANPGQTVLQVARQAGIYIPALCAHPDLTPVGNCRLCIVQTEDPLDFPLSCLTTVVDGMVVKTNTPEVNQLRRKGLEAILSRHPHACLVCSKRGTQECSSFHLADQEGPKPCALCPSDKHCELQKIADFIGIKEVTLPINYRVVPVEKGDPLFERDYSLCVVCGRCVKICQEVRGVKAVDFCRKDGQVASVGPISNNSFKDSGCKFCGACVEVCPTGALRDKGGVGENRDATLIPCRTACPAGIDIPRYIGLIAEGNFAEAVAVIKEKVPFPAVLGLVCPHPCEAACRRGQINESIAINALKRFATEHGKGLQQGQAKRPSSGKRVAVIGSGPAGLTAAYYLAGLGHQVTVFEALPEPGGMMRVGIPAYRLPREVLHDQIEGIISAGVDIKTGTKIESLGALFQQGYHAILVSVGAHKSLKMGIGDEDKPGMLEGVSLLRDVSLGVKVNLGKKVAVVGGGSVALDAARTALRLGAEEVVILYRRTRAEMPATPDEIEQALLEGMKIDFLVAPVKITSGDNGVTLTCARMKLGKKWDAKGRRLPEPIAGSEYDLKLDSVITAIGQTSDIPSGFGLSTRDGVVEIDPATFGTNILGVFAAGDVVSGPGTVIEAVASGKGAASSIDKYLGGRGVTDWTLPDNICNPWLGQDHDFALQPRSLMPLLPREQRLSGFAEVELGFDRELALREAQRCLRCHLRLCISPMMLPPSQKQTV